MVVARRSLLFVIAGAGAAMAADDPVLELHGAIAPPAPRRFDLAALDAIGRVELTTRTPWTQGPQRFLGVPLAQLLAAVGARGDTLRAEALNDYAITMPLPEVLEADAFIASRQDGAPMPVRHRGPFWLVFPWSRRPELDSAMFRQRAVWQLRRLDIA